jgi:hypothetical protein
MTGVSKLNDMALAALAACLFAGGVDAQSVGEREIAGVDKRYAIASKDFGDGKVQLHTRGEGADGGSHKVHTFSCVEQTYEVVFEGDQAPEAFPVEGEGSGARNLEKNSSTASLAAHACKEHGYPVLMMEW